MPLAAMKPLGVIPANAGTLEHAFSRDSIGQRSWAPAFAGVTHPVAEAVVR
ncbi:MAG: hypothetical protein QOG13_1742 [Sphingomonadales bacterium]|jgi:hypothetical protein|nr:hypothetical protein [Sphingomonadales bacterium]